MSPHNLIHQQGNALCRSLSEQVGDDLRCYVFLLLINAWAIVSTDSRSTCPGSPGSEQGLLPASKPVSPQDLAGGLFVRTFPSQNLLSVGTCAKLLFDDSFGPADPVG